MTKPQLTASDLAALFDALNRHDIDAVMAYFAQDCVSTASIEPGVGVTMSEGIEAIAAEFSSLWGEMKDARWDRHSHFVHGDRAASEWTFSGTDASGSRVEAVGCDLLVLDNCKIVWKQAFRKDLTVQACGQGVDG